MKQNITVIIPSYNRAHIINYTIPTYLENKYVAEVIVVNDCSTDNTIEVLEALVKKHNKIKYITLNKNFGQAYANNIGIKEAIGEYIYFGDDDSFLEVNAIDSLYHSMGNYAIMGARALYLDNEQDIYNLSDFLKRKNSVIGELFNLNTLEMNCQVYLSEIKPVYYCQACFIISTENAKKIMFDEYYKGNGYREETDFLLRASSMGLKIGYNPFIVQYNLPRSQATGGAHSLKKLNFYLCSIKNNTYFIRKNIKIIQEVFNTSRPAWVLIFQFIWNRSLGKIFL